MTIDDDGKQNDSATEMHTEIPSTIAALSRGNTNYIKIYKKFCVLWFFNYTKRLCYLLSEQGRGEAPSVPPHPALLFYEHLKYRPIHERLYYFKYNYAIFLFGSTPIQGEPSFVARFFRHKRS